MVPPSSLNPPLISSSARCGSNTSVSPTDRHIGEREGEAVAEYRVRLTNMYTVRTALLWIVEEKCI